MTEFKNWEVTALARAFPCSLSLEQLLWIDDKVSADPEIGPETVADMDEGLGERLSFQTRQHMTVMRKLPSPDEILTCKLTGDIGIDYAILATRMHKGAITREQFIEQLTNREKPNG